MSSTRAFYYFFYIFLLPLAFFIFKIGLDRELYINCCLSIFAFFGTLWAIPKCMAAHIRANLSGKDINKPGEKENKPWIPESIGLESSAFMILCIILTTSFFPSKNLAYSAILTILLTTFLGFADDVLNIPWRVKIFIPFISALPILLGYHGSTTICFHGFLSPLSHYFENECFNIGIFYYFYIICLFVFCTHSINIYAGINGLEVSQSLIVALALLNHSLYYYHESPDSRAAVFILIPFITTSLALLYYNWYPSRVFVGDTFTLTAGAVLATAGTLGHYCEMTLLFMLPELLNFILSLPQLIGIIPCPRHRLPHLQENGKLKGDKKNLNLVNYWLILFGEKKEDRLCVELIVFQICCCLFAYIIKYLYNHSLSP